MTDKFDDIRPYYDSELHPAMERISSSITFPLLASYVYPGEPLEKVRERVCNYTNVRDFQHETMSIAIGRIIENSMDGFSCHGLDQLSPDKCYLYISNHRDIMLDSSLLQYFLVQNGFDTTEITFGANLMMDPLIVDIGKCNKMFRVERPGTSVKEFYSNSLHLSEYIRFAITRKGESVWIAQRNGRTKDGNDRTDQGIIKMLCMSNLEDKVTALADLNIVPISISYEWEPCDILKTLELYESQFSRYIKKPGEDLNSIVTGIAQPKGRVHMEICRPISLEELEPLSSLRAIEFHRTVAELITGRINDAYRLYPNNYLAYDVVHGSSRFADNYTQAVRKAFSERVNSLLFYDSCDMEQLLGIFLGIYSNPLENKLKRCML